jgi:D-alanyl-D-alanine carboxypeptidase
MRPVFASAPGATSTTTPSSLPLKASAAALPQGLSQAAQAYAATPGPEASSVPVPPPSPVAMAGGAKIQARLANPEIVVARLDPPKTESVKSDPVKAEPLKSQPVKSQPVKSEKAEPAKIETGRSEPSRANAKPDAAEPVHERQNRTGWVIQLGATDDETRAKAILEEARSRSGRMLSKASPFTEKVVREGTTLYRARFSGFDESDAAQAACKTLKRSGFNCFATRS